MADQIEQNKEVVILLDNVRSALNVGAIIRTCDGAGVGRILVAGITPFPPHQKVLKTSLGAEEHIKFEKVEDIEMTIKEYKNNGFQILAIEETRLSKDFFRTKLADKILYIFGNEITGVSENILKIADETLSLPMQGTKNSLNVATTVGIILYNTMFSRYE
jgi:23S rRNA (guanosine2251-2'-O)-methyltransferase